MLRQQADQTDQAQQADQIPDQVARWAFGKAVLGFGSATTTLSSLRSSGADGRRHEEQREYHSPTHWHPPSLIKALVRVMDPAKTGIPTTNSASTQSKAGRWRKGRNINANARIDVRSGRPA